MPFQVSSKKSQQQVPFSKTYLKLIGIEFHCKKVEKAKQLYKQSIRDLGLDLSEKKWEIENELILVQVCELYNEPDVIRVQFNEKITLVYSKEQFKLKDEGLVKKLQELETHFF